MIKRFLIALLFMLCFVLFETSILSNITFFKVVPDLLLLASAYLAINNGKLYGLGIGFSGGLFLDFFAIGPFGLNCFVRTIVGYVLGRLRKSINTSGIIIPLVIGFSVTIMKGLILVFVTFLFPNVKDYSLFEFSFLFELIFNTVLAPFIFRFLNAFSGLLNIEIEKVV